jgi:hypothetical protein
LDGYVVCVFWAVTWFIRSSRDTYDIYYENSALVPPVQADPAPISTRSVWTLKEDEPDATVNDICKFIVEYINSDVMVRSLLRRLYPLRGPHEPQGMLANRHIIIADQSKV